MFSKLFSKLKSEKNNVVNQSDNFNSIMNFSKKYSKVSIPKEFMMLFIL